jgi:hypothetical protein
MGAAAIRGARALADCRTAAATPACQALRQGCPPSPGLAYTPHPGDGESQSFAAEELDGAQDNAASGSQERRQTTGQGKISQT